MAQRTILGDAVCRTEEEWRRILTLDQYRLLREKGKEKAFENKYWDNKREGIYVCAGCKNPLFSSKHKFEAGTGRPTFWDTISEESVNIWPGTRSGAYRMVIECAR